MRAHVLLVGRNIDVLIFCAQTLRSGGFVSSARTDVKRAAAAATAGDYDAVVFCDSVPQPRRQAAVIRTLRPSLPVFALCSLAADAGDDFDAILDPRADNGDFVAAVEVAITRRWQRFDHQTGPPLTSADPSCI